MYVLELKYIPQLYTNFRNTTRVHLANWTPTFAVQSNTLYIVIFWTKDSYAANEVKFLKEHPEECGKKLTKELAKERSKEHSRDHSKKCFKDCPKECFLYMVF